MTDQWEVPLFKEQQFFPKRSDYALVIPVINEGDRIRRQLRSIAGSNFPVDVIIIDGGSTDGSLDIDFLSSVGVRALLLKTGPGKLSAQLRVAYAWCLLQEYRGIITMDGNDKDGVEVIINFVGKLKEGWDYVQGSRYCPGGIAENTPLDREIGNRLIHAPILSLAGRHWFTDTTNGFRAYSAKYLLDPRVAPFRNIFNHYELLFYLTIRAGQLGFRVCEIPVTRRYPKNTLPPTKIAGWKGKLSILTQVIKTAANGFAPNQR